jgi:hypothetical protein
MTTRFYCWTDSGHASSDSPTPLRAGLATGHRSSVEPFCVGFGFHMDQEPTQKRRVEPGSRCQTRPERYAKTTSWARSRAPSLVIARYDSLPGVPFPARPSVYPTKDQTADYLEEYARALGLSVRSGVRVECLSAAGDRFQVVCDSGDLTADNVVVATGAYHDPRSHRLLSISIDPSDSCTRRSTETGASSGTVRFWWWVRATPGRRSPSTSPSITGSGYRVRIPVRSRPGPGACPIVCSRR